MIRGLIGKKLGMTQIFDKEGDVVPVTVVEAGPCTILDIKDSPMKVKLGFDPVRESLVNKPRQGFFKKVGVSPLRMIREFESSDNKDYKVGQQLTADVFKAGDFVDVSGTSIGKGFQGGMKRWHWDGGPKTHGSTSHRRVGSIGSSTTPGRVWKGHHMPGHMGNIRVTVSGLNVIKVDSENNLLAVKGAVPGYSNNYVMIRKTTKQKRQVIKPIIAEQKAESLKKDAKKQAAAKK